MESESTVSPILAILALTAVFGAAITALAVEIPAANAVRTFVDDHVQKVMLLVAGVAMGASLYYSDVVGFVPCEFCWYQRIAMYPLAVLLLVSVVTRIRMPSRYIVVLAGIGLALSLYHYQMQLFPDHAGSCSGGVSCSGKYIEQFGFITIPFMAGCGFLSVLFLQLAAWRVDRLFTRWYGHGVAGEA